MKKQIKRADVSKLLISDDYFTKGHFFLKLRQTLVAILGWMGVMLPFAWLLLPLGFPEFTQKYSFYTYVEEFQTLRFLLIFLSISFVLILILYSGLTIWNNYRFKNFLQKNVLFDEERLEKRRKLLNEAYDERFASKEIRHTVNYYSVSEEQNLDKDFFKELYKKNEVSL